MGMLTEEWESWTPLSGGYWGVHSPGGEGRHPSFRVWGEGEGSQVLNRLYNVTIKHLEQGVFYLTWALNRVWIFGDPQSKSVIPLLFFFLNLIPWSQFKEMDQGHEMSFLILNREVFCFFVFCFNRFKRMKVWKPFDIKPLPKLPFSVPPLPPHHPRHPREF